VGAILAGTNPGLTMVVGPPGTGKTDVAVQIIANLYHNFPDQHTLLVTHSNQALNQLFEKIMALGIYIYILYTKRIDKYPNNCLFLS
jgi:intron-binding protein aquarius